MDDEKLGLEIIRFSETMNYVSLFPTNFMSIYCRVLPALQQKKTGILIYITVGVLQTLLKRIKEDLRNTSISICANPKADRKAPSSLSTKLAERHKEFFEMKHSPRSSILPRCESLCYRAT